MNVSFDSNYGNFAYRMEAEVQNGVGEPALSLIKEGLANIAYRVCGSSVDKALGVDKNAGAFKTRRDVEYTNDTAEKIENTVVKKLNALNLGYIRFSILGPHEYGENGSPMARATLLVDTMLGAGQKDALCAVLMAETGASREDLIRVAHEKGLGIQKPKARKVEVAETKSAE